MSSREEDQEVALNGNSATLLVPCASSQKDAAWKEEYAKRLMHAALKSEDYEVRRRMYQTALQHAAQARELRRGEAIESWRASSNDEYEIPFADLLEDESVASMFEDQSENSVHDVNCKAVQPVLSAIQDSMGTQNDVPPLVVLCEEENDVSMASVDDESAALAAPENTPQKLERIVASMSFPQKGKKVPEKKVEEPSVKHAQQHPIHAGMLARAKPLQECPPEAPESPPAQEKQETESLPCQEVCLSGPIILDDKDEVVYGTIESNEVFLEIEPVPRYYGTMVPKQKKKDCSKSAPKSPTGVADMEHVAAATAPEKAVAPEKNMECLKNATSPTAGDDPQRPKAPVKTATESTAITTLSSKEEKIDQEERTQVDDAEKDIAVTEQSEKPSVETNKEGTYKKATSDTVTVWKSAVDSTTGRCYYYNRTTRETTWIKPRGENDVIVKPRVRSKNTRPAKPSWSSAVDANSNRTYYYNRTTGQTCWTKPSNYDQQHAAYQQALEEYTSARFPVTAKKQTPLRRWYKKKMNLETLQEHDDNSNDTVDKESQKNERDDGQGIDGRDETKQEGDCRNEVAAAKKDPNYIKEQPSDDKLECVTPLKVSSKRVSDLPDLQLVESFADEETAEPSSDNGLEAVLPVPEQGECDEKRSQRTEAVLPKEKLFNEKLSLQPRIRPLPKSLRSFSMQPSSSDVTAKADNLSTFKVLEEVQEEKSSSCFHHKEIPDIGGKAGLLTTRRDYLDSRDPDEEIDNGEEVLLVEEQVPTSNCKPAKSKRRPRLSILGSRRKVSHEKQQPPSRPIVVLSDMRQEKSSPENIDTEKLNSIAHAKENPKTRPNETVDIADIETRDARIAELEAKLAALEATQSQGSVQEQMQALVTSLKSGFMGSFSQSSPMERSQSIVPSGQETLLVSNKGRRLHLRPFKSRGTKIKANKNESVLLLPNDPTTVYS